MGETGLRVRWGLRILQMILETGALKTRTAAGPAM